MGFKELGIKNRYRSSEDDIVSMFFVPVLGRANSYKRAVGFFSSTSLIEISKGITGLVNNGGTVQLVVSPRLQDKDIEAINKGYETREKILERAMLDCFFEPKDYFQEKRLNLLAHLIAREQLDIKVAFLESRGLVGMYHEKIGVLTDSSNEKVAFTGSLNESASAYYENFESIEVFYTGRGEAETERIHNIENDFDLLWHNRTQKIQVVDFPKVLRQKLQAYKKTSFPDRVDEEQYSAIYRDGVPKAPPSAPSTIKLYDYQEAAINSWEKKKYRGVLNMATGTGKTFTALSGLSRLLEKRCGKLATFILCPYQHLVDQWVDEIEKFGIHPIIGYSASAQKDWKKRLSNAVIDYNLEVLNNFCFISTNATYASDFVQRQIKKVKKPALLIADEAHNLGATQLSTKLPDHFEYRLALSATIVRHGDPEGTEKLFAYFGEECINYEIEKAIKEKKLTPYYYYPILTYLTEGELEKYRQLTIQLSRCFIEKNGQKTLSEIGKYIAIKRARLVAGSVNKIISLEKEIQPYISETHTLVYCGATTVQDIDYTEGQPHVDELRQIQVVSDLLGNRYNMKVAQFTSKETAQQRERLKKEFAEGLNLQALIAIRCLDEGVNIPNIVRAFILASSTNPKEFIQRRGRVLRRAEGKGSAYIFDFITLPRDLAGVNSLTQSEINLDISLVKKEIDRMEEFSSIALNPRDSYDLIKQIEQAYGLDKVKL